MQVYEYSGKASNPYFPTARIMTFDASGVCWMVLDGEINSDTVRAFDLAHKNIESRECNEKWLFLESSGGIITDAMRIGRIVRAQKYNTTLGKGLGNCSSACGIIFISGIKRELPVPLLAGSIGFHQPAQTVGGKKVCQKESSTISQLILDFAKSVLPPEPAIDFHAKVMATECTGIKVYSYAELVKSGIATAIGGPDVF